MSNRDQQQLDDEFLAFREKELSTPTDSLRELDEFAKKLGYVRRKLVFDRHYYAHKSDLRLSALTIETVLLIKEKLT